MKRLLRPVRPVLKPAWRFLRRLVGRPLKTPAWPPPPEPTATEWILRRKPLPIHPMTKAQFVQLQARFRYYRARGRYMSAAATIAGDLIRRHRMHTALELGPHVHPIVNGADTMDIVAQPEMRGARRVIVHDATLVPWPFADRSCDLFVGLQVFEHLGGRQPEAFAEVCRVARHAIISLPIDWVMEDPTDCHHMLSGATALAWFAPRVPTRIVEGNPGPKARLIYVFEHLDRPAPAVPPPVPPTTRLR